MTNLTPTEVVQAVIDGKEIEFKSNTGTAWVLFDPNEYVITALIDGKYQFRIIQEVITIGDVSFPKPQTEYLLKDETYYMPDITKSDLYRWEYWEFDGHDKQALKNGMVHLTKENAIAHAKALIKLSGGVS